MKIGIVSMQEVINYGSFLQAYALKKLLGEENISFVSLHAIAGEKASSGRIDWLYEFSSLCRNKVRYLQNKCARRQMKSTILPFQKEYFSYEGGPYELLIAGSDEVFHFAQETSWDYGIFLGKGLEYNRICSFAASCGATTIAALTDDRRSFAEERLREFEAVSVRDKGTYELAAAMGVQDIQYHLDPVLLYDFQREMTDNPFCYPGDYMIVYSYNYRFSDPSEIGEIRRFAEKHKVKLIAVEGVQSWIRDYVAVNPFQLFHLFAKAKFIVTDTFHGTIIASKLHKNFAAFVRDSNANKLGDLLDRVGIGEHGYSKGKLESILLYQDDYRCYEAILERGRSSAENYLKRLKAGKEK